MLDFLIVSVRYNKSGRAEIYPRFVLKKTSDLMIRGGDFYAIWVEERGLWSTDELDAVALIDKELDEYAKANIEKYGTNANVLHMWDSSTGMIDAWHKFCQRQSRDSYHSLDEELIFANTEVTKTSYASKKLSYALAEGDISAYDHLMSVLYSPEERHKIEWAIGSIVTGDSKSIQKFMVLYGSPGAGKGTIINIIEKLFEGYVGHFNAKEIGTSSASFALEAFRSNPLVAINHDGDLSKIDDNTRLNSLISHEKMTVNEKFKSAYTSSFKCFLFIATNKPVKITDAKSGLMRRLIDATPTGNKIPAKEYRELVKKIDFELGAIAWHCKEVFLDDPEAYDAYAPLDMLTKSNDFYNFIIDLYMEFKGKDKVLANDAWDKYNKYVESAKVPFPLSRRQFNEELANYFKEYHTRDENGEMIRPYYSGFTSNMFLEQNKKDEMKEENEAPDKCWIELKAQKSILDRELSLCPAQYSTTGEEEKPMKAWAYVATTLADIDTSRLHYVKVPANHIVIDFDLKDKKGNKSLELNLKAASEWPKTYAEVSKGGQGLHLHYIYSGDASKLAVVYSEGIEIKRAIGNSTIRRKLSRCNDIPVATINSGLPLKGDDGKMMDASIVTTEKGLRTTIAKCLNKEVHEYTKGNIDFIYDILEKAYESGVKYDVSDTENAVTALAAQSTNNADYCLKLVNKMHFKSDEGGECVENEEKPIAFFDIEIFPNLFLICWKLAGKDKTVVRMFNPTPDEVMQFINAFRLIGFNNRRYDNHLVYAAGVIGYSVEQLYLLSQAIIVKKDRNSMFREAYNISYTDIYDFASAGNKMSLKKLEIKMGIHHQELGLPWDKPVPKELWEKVGEYCVNDVLATEAAFDFLKADWTARQILADLAGMTVNDSTNSLTARIIFGKNKHPQDQFNYRNLAEPVFELDDETFKFLKESCPDMMAERHGEAKSLLPYFPGYTTNGKTSFYRDMEAKEGGFVLAKEGMAGNVALLDIASMHPHSGIAEVVFGVKYTKAFRDIVEGRVSIKHEAWDEVNHMLDGKLTPYIKKVIDGEMTSDDLANALKTAINAVYGQTYTSYDNPFRDKRNTDNFVAKRGSLFMIDLYYAVKEKGFTVMHIKTDSIKIPDATPEIIQFVMDFGKRYGYTFEHEATYERMCLVNGSTYIAKYATPEQCEKLYGYAPKKNVKKAGKWDAVADQFKVPYVFKTLFSKEDITFDDMCETFSTESALYLDMNEDLPDVSKLEKALDKLMKDAPDDPGIDGLREEIAKGHEYHFIGKVGQFSPVKPGCGGGELMREQKGKYYAATDSKGYRWLESEMLRSNGNTDIVDRSYYEKQVTKAVEDISEYGDFEWFVSDDPYVPGMFEEDVELPFY